LQDVPSSHAGVMPPAGPGGSFSKEAQLCRRGCVSLVPCALAGGGSRRAEPGSAVA